MAESVPAEHPTSQKRFSLTPSGKSLLWLVLVILVLLLAAGLRFHQIDAQSLWNDEGTTVAMTGRTIAQIITNTAADIHPPGYYLLLTGWTRLVGTGELALRIPSAFAGVLTVALGIALGRRLFGRDAGLFAGLLLAANTFALYYAQEARMYALLGLLASLSMWLLVVWLGTFKTSTTHQNGRYSDLPPHNAFPLRTLQPLRFKKNNLLIMLALVNAAGLYTHYAYPFTMIAQGIIFVFWWIPRRTIRPLIAYIVVNLMTLALFAPWTGAAIRQVTTWPNSGGPTDPALALRTLTLGITAQAGVGWIVLLAVLIAAAALWMLRRYPLWVVPVVWTLCTVGPFLVLALQTDDLKQLLPAASALALWLGAGLAALWRDDCLTPRILAISSTAILGLTLAGSLSPFYSDPAYQRADYRGMAATITAQERPGDAIILNGPGQGEVWSYYYTGSAPVYPLPTALGGDDAATQAAMDALLQDHRRVFVLFWGEQERDPNGIVERSLDTTAFEVGSQWVGDVRFVTYAVPGETPTEPTTRLDLRFGNENGQPITLIGTALDRTTYVPGDALTLSLFWQTAASLDTRYKVFVHLYTDATAPPLAQHDSEPGSGEFPTVDWQPDDMVIDRHGLLLPPDLPAGTYTLAVGLYDAADPATRLTADLPAGPESRVPIATITVERAG